LYCNHYLTGFLANDIPEEFCTKPIKQIVWLVESNGTMYIVGWAKNVQLYSSVVRKNVRGSGIGTIEYQFKYLQNDGKIILPSNAIECLYEGEIPDSLMNFGICRSSDINVSILKEIIDIINSYNLDFADMGIMNSTLDAVPGIETENVSELIQLAQKVDGWDRRLLLMNKAVGIEKSYRTYLHREVAFFDCWIVFCKHFWTKNAGTIPKSCMGKFLIIACPSGYRFGYRRDAVAGIHCC
jgi:hypothetical protein